MSVLQIDEAPKTEYANSYQRAQTFVRRLFPVRRLRVRTAICLLSAILLFNIASMDIFATTVDGLFFGNRSTHTTTTKAAGTAAGTSTTTTNAMDVGVVVYDGSNTYRRLGNHIFAFAVVVDVAERSRRRVVATRKLQLDKVFDLTDVERVTGADELCPCFRFGEEKALAYDPRIEQMARPDNPKTQNLAILLDGYYQSWKYARTVENRLRSYLVFLPDLLDYVDAFFERSAPRSWNKGFTRVGIHVRRGDVASESAAKAGYSVPDETYFQKAMQYMYAVVIRKRTQFVVCSDDPTWSRDHITLAPYNRSNVDVTFCDGRRREEDFAVLSNCDHVIMSTGTFGWWAAWIANGLTIFYSNWPLVNTSLYSAFNYDDFFPPTWIPME